MNTLKRRWRFLSFNAENLFVYFDEPPPREGVFHLSESEWQRLSRSTIKNKKLNDLKQIAQFFEELDPDLIMLCEVGGMESLTGFNSGFLRDQYRPFLLEGNSQRGIDVGFLVKKELLESWRCELRSHKDRLLDFQYPHEKLSLETGYIKKVPRHRFSRDVAEMRIYLEGYHIPQFIILLVHLKSPLDKEKLDPGGRDRRRSEQRALIKIYTEIRQEFSQEAVPVLVAGDFNGSVFGSSCDEEFEELRQTDLKCCLELAEVPEDERFTWLYVHNRRPTYFRQLDYILLSPELHGHVDKNETWVYRFRDEKGLYRTIPKTLNERRLLPSDHYPIILTLNSVNSPSS